MTDALDRIEALANAAIAESMLPANQTQAILKITPRPDPLASVVPLLVAVARAADQCAILENDPRRNPEQNKLLAFRAQRFREALAAVDRYATEHLPA